VLLPEIGSTAGPRIRNYLYAVAECQLQRLTEPLEIAARKVHQFDSGEKELFDDLRNTLYAGFGDEYSNGWQYPQADMLSAGNGTLDEVAKVCWQTIVDLPNVVLAQDRPQPSSSYRSPWTVPIPVANVIFPVKHVIPKLRLCTGGNCLRYRRSFLAFALALFEVMIGQSNHSDV